MPNSNVHYVNYRIEIEGDGLANFLKDVGRPWDFTVSRYGMELRVKFDKPFSLWNVRRPSAYTWDRYFIRSPFVDFESKDDLWINMNKRMWGPQNDARNVYSYMGESLDGGLPRHVITFQVETDIHSEVFHDLFARHKNVSGVLYSCSWNDYNTIKTPFADGRMGKHEWVSGRLIEPEVSE